MYLISAKRFSFTLLNLTNGQGSISLRMMSKLAEILLSMPIVPLILNMYYPGEYFCISDVSKLNCPVTGSKVTVPGSLHLKSPSNPLTPYASMHSKVTGQTGGSTMRDFAVNVVPPSV